MFGLPVIGALSCFSSVPCLMDHPHPGRWGELIIQMHILMPYIQKKPSAVLNMPSIYRCVPLCPAISPEPVLCRMTAQNVNCELPLMPIDPPGSSISQTNQTSSPLSFRRTPHANGILLVV